MNEIIYMKRFTEELNDLNYQGTIKYFLKISENVRNPSNSVRKPWVHLLQSSVFFGNVRKSSYNLRQPSEVFG